MGSTSKSIHRKVQIKHDLMTRKFKYTLMYSLFLPLVITVTSKYSEGKGASVCASAGKPHDCDYKR